MIRGSGCSKSRLAKAEGAGVAVQQRSEKWQAAVARYLEVKMHKTPQVRSNVWSSDVKKRHVARSTFASQNAQNTFASEQFWSSDAQKWPAAVARSAFVSQNDQVRSNFSSSDVQKWHAAVARSTFGSQNAQNTTCPDQLQVKIIQKIDGFRPLFDLRIWKNGTAGAVVRSTFGSQNVEKLKGAKPRCRKISQLVS